MSCKECERLEAKLAEVEQLAYIGEHHFPDATYKHRLEELAPKLRDLEQERDRYREALEFYADPVEYKIEINMVSEELLTGRIQQDQGKTARKALNLEGE